MNTQKTDWQKSPWHPHLSWIADLESLATEEHSFLKLVQQGLKHRKFMDRVSLQERSIELTGDPNRLIELSQTRLFADDRLNWDILGCWNEGYVLLCCNCNSSAIKIHRANGDGEFSWQDFECRKCEKFTRIYYDKNAVSGAKSVRVKPIPNHKSGSNLVKIEVNLTSEEAYALSQYLKHVRFEDFLNRAIDEDDAYVMHDVATEIRKALAEVGYEPR